MNLFNQLICPHDLNGNLLNETTGTTVTSYGWDKDNRLRTFTPPTGTSTSYSYGANGLRTERIDGTGTTRYLLDGRSVLEELDAVNASTTSYFNNPHVVDEVLAYQRGGATSFPLTDGLGSVYAATDASGAVVHRYDFDAYGTRADLGGTASATDLGYVGKHHDGDGIMGMGDRPYSPRAGVWLEPDRAGMIDGPNLYNYVGNMPTMATDPTGRAFDVDFDVDFPDGAAYGIYTSYLDILMYVQMPYGLNELAAQCSRLAQYPNLNAEIRRWLTTADIDIRFDPNPFKTALGKKVGTPAYAVTLSSTHAQIFLTPLVGFAEYYVTSPSNPSLGRVGPFNLVGNVAGTLIDSYGALLMHEVAHLAGIPQTDEAAANSVGALYRDIGPQFTGTTTVPIQ